MGHEDKSPEEAEKIVNRILPMSHFFSFKMYSKSRFKIKKGSFGEKIHLIKGLILSEELDSRSESDE